MEQNERKRTERQSRALHKFFSLLADELNTNGLEMKIVLKPEYELWWNGTSVKNHLWKPLQHAMYGKRSTTELTTSEINKVFEQIAKIIGDKFGLELIFPSIEETENYLNSFKE